MSCSDTAKNSVFSLDNLKSLLMNDEDDEERLKPVSNPEISKALEESYHFHGMIPPAKGLWQRPIPQILYHCPLSEPTTTLTSWNALPRTIQEMYERPIDGDIVEVDSNHLLSDNMRRAEGGGREGRSTENEPGVVRGMQRRPLQGNMTNKLTEYTRGITGRANPFLPGGLESADGASTGVLLDQDPSVSAESIERSMDVLKYGSKAAWENGTLLTAPHGTTFKVGISIRDIDIHGEGSDQELIDNQQTQGDTVEQQHVSTATDDKISVVATPNPTGEQFVYTTTTAPIVQWEKRLLDDDSLFGSSVDSENDSSSDATSGSGSASESGSQEDSPLDNEDLPDAQKAIQESDPNNSLDIDSPSSEIDNLLLEMIQVENRSKFLPKHHHGDRDQDDSIGNPLRLAERQARLQTSSTNKKTWASTKLLPIQDLSTFVPNPALKYSFTLDPFQQQAVARLERSESIFVAAHTSAGKTAIAEYAVALARQRGTRCIYTSPIKALSNQKFRDFSLKFGSENVGLVTGDLQVNVDDSTCLIMTTEILRSMLYRGADLIRDIEFVVFDEVHYVNDSERGVVWEETIILLPSYVNLIFLSATTPNTFEFSDWIGRTKKKPVYVIRTDYRPVPLSHYLWANLKLHKVKEGDGGFLEKGYQGAVSALEKTSQSSTDGKRKAGPSTAAGRGPPSMTWQSQGGKSQWMSLIRFLCKEELTPTVIFTFSKKKCEEVANMLRSLDLNTSKENSSVRAFASQTVARLSPTDKFLPQVMAVCEMVERGIGVHHGGLLPILKEMVEILFSRNLIKVLFATETFAMGVNMPARSVVFNSIRKHDGKQFRVLEPGEYTQMAGRAGRRGLDKVGTVIVCCFGEKPPPVGILRTMLTGTSTMLRSQFRLTYNMILNLLRVEEMSVESMIKRSFSEFATQRALTANEYPKLLARGKKTLAKLVDQFEAESNQRIGAHDLEDYFQMCQRLKELNFDVLTAIETSIGRADGFLEPGRVLLITDARKLGVVRAPGMILAPYYGREGAVDFKVSQDVSLFVCMILLPSSYVSNGEDAIEAMTRDLDACSIGEVGYAKERYYAIVTVELGQILLVTSTKKKINPWAGNANIQQASLSRIKCPDRMVHDPFAGKIASNTKKRDEDDTMVFGKKNDRSKDTTSSTIGKVGEVVAALIESEHQELSSGLAMLDLNDFLKRGTEAVELRQRADTISSLSVEMRNCESHHHPTIEKHFVLLERLHALRSHVESLSHLLSNESLLLFPDFLQRKTVLKVLGYLDEKEAVTVKGRVACEVNSCEELIITELVFEGVLNDLEPSVIVAALSSLVYQQKSSEDEELNSEVPESLLSCCEKMKMIAMNLGKLQKEQGLDVDPLEYTESSLHFGLVHVVYEWAIGVPFSAITQLTTAQEGSIVRCITRLDELCREVRNCARVVGNPTLYQKMEVASAAIKRDIVFAASLYVS
ncbi:DEAD/DEAH box helicase domain protein [Nitzschia inconspicua]|uniref:DEAD/DEAH box helicase domain protein n=1 Tax=Nitzschia inconspicua TaxID=303405 RepID=A0A9K3L4W2_9STRA|nr:DEAD/DEAH box helicase domain protein [Nitzschia inconspicua]